MKHQQLTVLISTILIFLLGYSLASFREIGGEGLSTNTSVSFIGRVIDQSEDENKWSTLKTDALISDSGTLHEISMNVRLYLPDKAIKILMGDSLLVRGEISFPTGKRNPGGFDLKKHYHSNYITAFLSRNGISSIKLLSRSEHQYYISRIVNNIRYSLHERLSLLVSPESSPIAKSLLLGNKNSIDDELKDKFRNTGVIHILVISGLHVSFIVGILYIIGSLFRLKRNHLVYFILSGIILYASIVGWRTPITRAVIMASALLIGTISERRAVALNTLGIAAIIILLIKPDEIYQPGFHLSFLIVSSILFFNKKLLENIPNPAPINFINRKIRWFLPFLLMTTAANLMSIPLTAYHFSMITPFSLIINIIAVPLAGILVSLGFTMMAFSYIYLPIGIVLGSTFDLLTKILLTILSFFSERSNMVISIPEFPIWMLILLISLIFSLGYLNSSSGRFRFILLILLIMNGLGWSRSLSYKGAEVTFLDVGQGDAAYIEDSFGKNIIIDSGQSNFWSDAGRYVIGPFLRSKGINTIDYLLLTHQDSDHTGGAIYILENFNIDTLITSSSDSGSSTYLKVLAVARRMNVPRKKTKMGETIKLGSYSTINILHPPSNNVTSFSNSNNNSSIVFKYNYGESSILFTGDIESPVENKLVDSGYNLKSQILKVPHHGSSSSSTNLFIDAVSPKEAIISAGRHNLFGHPTEEVTNRYIESSITLRRTDSDKAIVMRADGNTIENQKWE